MPTIHQSLPQKAKKCTKLLKNHGNFLTSDYAKHTHTPTQSLNTLHNIQNTCVTFSTLVSINCLQQTQVSENQVQNNDISVNCCI